ncbi:phosphoribosylglycinamide formyltransferase [mine drainage metagenome]|uniref:phosphoribosylglycinamide formyltransferase 1 n=1 Tax=mine drainage metagenome TaxID=410659 RepID=A0A1J5SJQ6_9ZZZZ
MKSVVILISGRGSNMQALLEADLPCRIAAVISNRADAQGLEIARTRGIPTAVVPHRDYADRASFDAALAAAIDRHAPDVIALAGFMRILTDHFVERYRGKLINIHPSLLPAYPGIDTHERALRDGIKIHGCTVHFVTPTLDHGPIIIQAAVPVLRDDTPESLSARVLGEEHRVYAQAIRWLCRGQVWLNKESRTASDRLEQPGAALVFPGLE